jgi:hypothetical protein
MPRSTVTLMTLVVALGLAAEGALAQWPADPGLNLAIAHGNGEQVLPKLARTDDGSTYVAGSIRGRGATR